MRRQIVHAGAGSLRYEIREIVEFAHAVEAMGQSITWENIGDPLQKGDGPPAWIREIIHELVDDPASWGYCHSAGVPATREFLAAEVNRRPGGIQVTTDDILFFNGVGDAVAKVYGFLPPQARILGPSPAYSTHSSAEAAHSGYQHLTYELDPVSGWLPDIEDIRNKCRYNDSIAGILLLSPDNPTGAVYPRELLIEIAKIAGECGLFLIADEIYAHIVYNGAAHMHMSEWLGDVPGLAMRGISKEFPWPGSRCGWLEVLNRDSDDLFAAYVDSLLAAKRLEVSSTTLPQLSIPKVFADPRYPEHLAEREQTYAARAVEAVSVLQQCEGIVVNPPGGAFYLTVMFEQDVLNERQSLPIDDPKLRTFVESHVADVALDKRFVYYLLAATGIVVVPLSGFQCRHPGFRVTILEADDTKRAWTFNTLRESIDQYLKSAG